MTSEKFCLNLNDFQHNIISSYQDLRKDGEFSDVTLVCEDDHQIEAHRIILAACSPFFSAVLKRNKHPHPMLYMRGIKAKELVAIVDFIYHGEANIDQEDLDGFLALADELQLKGLASSENQPYDDFENPIKMKPEQYDNIQVAPQKKRVQNHITKDMNEENIECTSLVQAEDGKLLVPDEANTEELQVQIGTMMEKIHEGDYSWKCRVCGKMTKGSLTQMKRHVETHLEGVSHTCKQCGKVSRSSTALSMHVHTYHRK